MMPEKKGIEFKLVCMHSKAIKFLICLCLLLCLSDTMFGRLPELEVNGQVISQSLAIGRYVAKLASKCNNRVTLEISVVNFLQKNYNIKKTLLNIL